MDVEQHDLRAEQRCGIETRGTVGGLADDVEALRLEQRRSLCPEARMVVDDQNVHWSHRRTPEPRGEYGYPHSFGQPPATSASPVRRRARPVPRDRDRLARRTAAAGPSRPLRRARHGGRPDAAPPAAARELTSRAWT